MGTTAKKKAAPLTVSSFVIRTHTSTHYRRKTPNRPSAHPLPASPTASLNVRNLCSGECSGKGQPMVMPQLTLCFTAVSGRRRSPTDRSLTSTDSPTYQHHCHGNFKYTSRAKRWRFLQRPTPQHRLFSPPTHYTICIRAQEDYT